MSTSSPLAPVERLDDHLAGDEAVRREEVGHLAALPHRADEEVVHLVLRRGVDVVREEVDLRRHVTERRPGRALGEAGRDLVRDAEGALLLERPPHRGRGRAGPGDEEQVRIRLLHLLRERREVLRRERHEQPADLVALRADDRVDGRVVADPEGRVLREDGDLLADALEERRRGLHVLVGLAARAEGVLVDAGDRVRRRRARDEEHLVLLGERRHLQRDAGRDAAGEDLVALADQVLAGGDGLRRIGAVVDDRQLDRAAVDLHRALGRVREPVAQALDVLGAVGREQPRARIDDPDLVGGSGGRARARLAGLACAPVAKPARSAVAAASVATPFQRLTCISLTSVRRKA